MWSFMEKVNMIVFKLQGINNNNYRNYWSSHFLSVFKEQVKPEMNTEWPIPRCPSDLKKSVLNYNAI